MRAGRWCVPGGWLRELCGRYRRCGRRDRGLATVWAALATVTLCTVFAVVLALGQVVVARHRAGGAADLAALAAADRALDGAAEACRAARQVAGAQGAEVVWCAVQGEIADVAARVRVGPYAPEVRSRAGPVVAPPVATGPMAAQTAQAGPAGPGHPGSPVSPARPAVPGSPEGHEAREVRIGGAR